MKFSVIFLIFFMFSYHNFAQSIGDDGLDSDGLEVEAIYEQLDSKEVNVKDSEDSLEKTSREKPKEKIYESIQRMSQLSELAPFKDVAVISKKYLPKSHRFEFSTGGLFVLNNVFFNGKGLYFKGAFYFSEKLGVEAHYYYLSSSERDVTSHLRKRKQILTRSLVDPSAFLGGAIRWSPIYGKISLFEKRIIPFDLSFSLGYGETNLQAKVGSNLKGFDGVGTIHLGVGQKFALSKSVAFRWDINWNFYSVKVNRLGNDGTDSLDHLDLYFGAGLSFFFPGASSR